MDQRKGDLRIYIVTLLFLSCIVSGGVFLGLYLLLPDPHPLFLQAGMVFVGIPWLFWFLAYVYSCVLKPCTLSVSKSVANFDPEKGEEKTKIPEYATPASDPVAAVVEPRASSPKEGATTRTEDEDKEQDNQESGRSNSRSDVDGSSVDEDCDRTPLRTTVGNK